MLRLQPANSPNPLLLPSVYTSSAVQELLHNATRVQLHAGMYEILKHKTWHDHTVFALYVKIGFILASEMSVDNIAKFCLHATVMSLSLCFKAVSAEVKKKNIHI